MRFRGAKIQTFLILTKFFFTTWSEGGAERATRARRNQGEAGGTPTAPRVPDRLRSEEAAPAPRDLSPRTCEAMCEEERGAERGTGKAEERSLERRGATPRPRAASNASGGGAASKASGGDRGESLRAGPAEAGTH